MCWRCRYRGTELRSGVSVSEPYPRHWHEEYQLCFIQAGGGELFYQGTHHSTRKRRCSLCTPAKFIPTKRTLAARFIEFIIEPELMRSLVATLTDQEQPVLPFFPAPIVFLIHRSIRLYLKLQTALTTTDTHLRKESIMLALLAKLVSRYDRPGSSRDCKKLNCG